MNTRKVSGNLMLEDYKDLKHNTGIAILFIFMNSVLYHFCNISNVLTCIDAPMKGVSK